MKLAWPVLGLTFAIVVVACGSSGVDEYPGYRSGSPASPAPTYGSDGGPGKSSSGGSSSSGSGGGGSSSGSSSGGDGGTVSFGNSTLASFTLIDGSVTSDPAGSPVTGYDPILYGSTIDLGKVGVYLSMRADLPPVGAVGSVAFALDATFTHTAASMPYSLCGDDGKGKFTPCVLPVGKHTLTATLYPMADLGGEPYQPPTVFEFNVVDSRLDGGADAAPE
jgi:hypothetical protein